MSDRDLEVVELEEQIGALVQKLAARKATIDHEGEPFVICWGLAYEYENHALVSERAAARSVIVPDGQSISASVGLGAFLSQSFDPGWTP